jgi:hypothetical protein
MNNLSQSVNQYDILDNLPKRVIIQFVDTETGENKQVLVNFSDLEAEQQTVFESYEALCELLMNA